MDPQCRVSAGPRGRVWAGATPRPLTPASLLTRMEWAAGNRGRDPRGQPGPWELGVGLLLSGEKPVKAGPLGMGWLGGGQPALGPPPGEHRATG